MLRKMELVPSKRPMARRADRSFCAWITAAAGIAGALSVAAAVFPSQAQDRSAILRQLDHADDFRVRVQAAFALGNLREPAAVPALAHALSDQNPAVRAAAATALGRIGSADALPALRRASSDSSAAVRMQVERSIRQIEEVRGALATRPTTASGSSSPSARILGISPSIEIVPAEGQVSWGSVRHLVILGDLANRSDFSSTALTGHFRSEITRQLRVIRGVGVLQSEIHLDDRARREVRRRRIATLRLDGNINQVRRERRGRDVSVRCEISLMILDGTQRSIRGELRGAATGIEPRHPRDVRQQENRLAEQALAGAVRSAMSNADQAIARASDS